MSAQQLERPPAYSDLHALADTPLSAPNLKRVPADEKSFMIDASSMATALPQRQHLPPSDTNASHSASRTTYSPSEIARQSLQFPTVPAKEPRERAQSTASSVNAMSLDAERRDQSASIEDPDDRMAAEALCGLGKVDSARTVRPRTPSGYDTPLKYYPIPVHETRSASTNANGETEPLLSLLTSSHPWLGGTISGSMSAYSSTKNHSPRFIQHSADYIEKHIGSPVAHTVESVGKKTGVEGGLRRYLGSKQHSEHAAELIDPNILDAESPTSNKRRRISSEADDTDIAMGIPIQRTLSGNLSVDTLPIYDDNRSPEYEPTDSSTMQRRQRPPVPRSWSTQVIISTSGLGAALNEASLRSLKYVLHILKNANTHVGDLMDRLKKLLHDYDNGRISHTDDGDSEKNGQRPSTTAQRIQHLNAEIWRTLKSVVNTVSRYTGGTLPENASVIVRWQLMSVPRRWQKVVNESSNSPTHANEKGDGSQSEKEAVSNAHRMLAFAVEGIDMMEQVGGVVSSTIESAERWLDSMGRKRQRERGDNGQVDAEDASRLSRQEEDVPMVESNGNGDTAEGMLIDASS